MTKALPLLLALALLSGCAMAHVSSKEESYAIYYRSDSTGDYRADAVASERFEPETPPATTEALAQALLERMLGEPESEDLRRAIPKNTQLISLRLSGTHAYVDFTAAYGTLSGIELTLADYCIVLTLTQLPEISVVSISVRGEPLAYRGTQNLTARDVLLSNSADVISTVEVRLYFAEGNALTAEPRTLELYEGETQVGKVLAALLAGPQSKALSPSLPEDFAILSAWLQDGTCYLNLPAQSVAEPQNARRIVQALVSSLCSLDSVENVQIMVEGEIHAAWGSVAIGGLLQSNTEK